MDCQRNVRRVRSLVLPALGLLLGLAGCQTMMSGTKTTQAPQAKEAEPVKHQAATYVAFADFRARSGFAPEYPPDSQQQFREEAKLSYLKAIEVDPKHLPAHLGLARLAAKCENFAASVSTYQKALEITPGDATLWHELALVQCRQKDWHSATISLKKACELAPNNRQFANTLGLTYARAGRTDEAIAILSQLHGQAKAHYDLARMLKHMGRVAEAKQHLQVTLARDPANKAAKDFLATIDAPPAPLANAPAQTPATLPASVERAPVLHRVSQPEAPAPVIQQVQSAAPEGVQQTIQSPEQMEQEPAPRIITPGTGNTVPGADSGPVGKPIPVPPLPVIRLKSKSD